MYSLIVLEVRGAKSRCWQGNAPEGAKEGSVAGRPPTSLTYGCITAATSLSLSRTLHILSPCVCIQISVLYTGLDPT